MDGATATPNAVIDVTSVKVDGTEIPLTKKSFTNTEDTEIDGTKHSNVRSNIFNEWVPDDSLPAMQEVQRATLQIWQTSPIILQLSWIRLLSVTGQPSKLLST